MTDKTDKELIQSGTQVVISGEGKELVDLTTGEVMRVSDVTKYVYGNKNFWKCYLMDFLSVLGIIESRQLDVFIYIAENTQPANNVFLGTYSKISRDTGVSRPTIASIMKKLQEHNFIKKIQNGTWLVNPDILMKGGERKKQLLLTYYESESPIDSITQPKGIKTIEEDF